MLLFIKLIKIKIHRRIVESFYAIKKKETVIPRNYMQLTVQRSENILYTIHSLVKR